VRYHDLYPGIDLSYSGDQRQVQYQFVAGPGADPKRIVLGWQGVDSVGVDDQGGLVLRTAWGAVHQGKPVIYQELGGARRDIAGGYVPKGADRVGVQVTGYKASQPLVIVSTLPLDGVPPTVAAIVSRGPSDATHFSTTPTR
jgi:hypothetical protein